MEQKKPLFSKAESEIVSPQYGDRVFARFLAEKGPGVPRICVDNGDWTQTLERMRAAESKADASAYL